MSDLVLTGFMGTGKTTVGHLLAGRFGATFVDLDQEVEKLAGCSIDEIFATRGEAEFRRLETAMLRQLVAGDNRIIATGGGALVSPENRSLLHPDQTVICLTCDSAELEGRLQSASNRPLLGAGIHHAVTDLLSRRQSAYDQFDQIDTSGKAPEEVADEIARRVRLAWTSGFKVAIARESSVFFQRGAVGRSREAFACRHLEGEVVLVTDRTVAALDINQELCTALEAAGCMVHRATIAPGEKYKSLGTVHRLYGICRRHRLDRQAIVVGLGGGVICDVAGMLAATYLRGLTLALVPTTLLAQVDAAIGGKVGVDFDGVKNLVGALHPADLIVVDPDALATLPAERIREGLVEMVKIALVRSDGLLHLLEELPGDHAVRDHPALIRQAIEEKIRVVQRDPDERGERAILNFGHTVGHALEAASGYQLSHGDAVSVGMAAETWLAVKKGWCDPRVLERLVALLQRFGLPTGATNLDPGMVSAYMGQDKKRRAGQLRFALPTGWGEGRVVEVGEADAQAAICRSLEVAV